MAATREVVGRVKEDGQLHLSCYVRSTKQIN